MTFANVVSAVRVGVEVDLTSGGEAGCGSDEDGSEVHVGQRLLLPLEWYG